MWKPNPPKPQHRRGLTKIKTTEITRVSRGVLAAGLTLRGVEVDPATGKYRVLVGAPGETTANGNGGDA